MKLSIIIFVLLISFSHQWDIHKFIHKIENHVKHIIPNKSTKPAPPKKAPKPPTPL